MKIDIAKMEEFKKDELKLNDIVFYILTKGTYNISQTYKISKIVKISEKRKVITMKNGDKLRTNQPFYKINDYINDYFNKVKLIKNIKDKINYIKLDLDNMLNKITKEELSNSQLKNILELLDFKIKIQDKKRPK